MKFSHGFDRFSKPVSVYVPWQEAPLPIAGIGASGLTRNDDENFVIVPVEIRFRDGMVRTVTFFTWSSDEYDVEIGAEVENYPFGLEYSVWEIGRNVCLDAILQRHSPLTPVDIE